MEEEDKMGIYLRGMVNGVRSGAVPLPSNAKPKGCTCSCCGQQSVAPADEVCEVANATRMFILLPPEGIFGAGASSW